MLIKVGIVGFVLYLVDVFLEKMILHVFYTSIPLFKEAAWSPTKLVGFKQTRITISREFEEGPAGINGGEVFILTDGMYIWNVYNTPRSVKAAIMSNFGDGGSRILMTGGCKLGALGDCKLACKAFFGYPYRHRQKQIKNLS